MRKNATTGNNIHSVLRDLNVSVHLDDLCGKCRGFACKMLGGYLILIEESMCPEAQLITLEHELMHIVLGHLDDDVKSEAQKEQEVIEHLKGE